jgi:hypothetical protein
MTGLDAPRTSDELYLVRGAEVEPFRPIVTGDVFRDVVIPGVSTDPGLALVLAHPCSMRQGAHLRSHVQMAAVQRGSPIDLPHWNGNFGVMPLPELQRSRDRRDRAVFELAGRVATEVLTPDRRIACLGTTGLLLLLQRLAFHLTRVAIDLDTLLQSIDYVLEETDLLEEWMRARLDVGAPQLQTAILQNEAAFDDVMGSLVSGVTLREALRDPKRRATVRRAVHRALAD